MKVPPLCTVAVSASAQAPSPRFPRKKPLRNEPFCIARLAIVPIHIDARTNRISAASAPKPTAGCSGIGHLSLVRGAGRRGFGFRIPSQVFVAHHHAAEDEGEGEAHSPAKNDSPEDPVGVAEDEFQLIKRSLISALRA